MMSPSSFKYSSLPPPNSRLPPSSSFSSARSARPQLPPSSSSSSSSLSTSLSTSTFAFSPPTSPPATPRYICAPSTSSNTHEPSQPRTIPNTPTIHHQRQRRTPKYEHDKPDYFAINVSPAPASSPSTSRAFYATMAKRKERRETTSLSPSSPPTTTTDLSVRPTTPTSPVQIPKASKRNHADITRPHVGARRRGKDVHTPTSISPSMAALLAVTDIPRPRQGSRRLRKRNPDKPLTVEDIFDQSQVSEKELSWSLSRGTMDMLLTPPEHLDDDLSISDGNVGSAMSMRTVSVDSIPSLGESFATEHMSSVDTPSRSSSRRRSSGPTRKALEPVASPEQIEDHPLALAGLGLDDFDSEFLGQPLEAVPERRPLTPFKPLRSVFKSNLTASLRALRSAAKSFSSISFATVPSEALLTRSLLTMDPKVPYTDERMPPVTEDMPSAEVRRYLNPSTSSHHEPLPASTPVPGSFSASIQMQTYKIQRSRSPSPTTHSPNPHAYLQTSSSGSDRSSQQTPHASSQHPGMRQREMRENSDFIRIAVMEMAMRKRGKLDDQRPGRARWALPPRKAILKPYGVNTDGVPERWVPVSL